MGTNFIQFICQNILHVHARRHPQKRLYVKEEENPYSFIDEKHDNFQQFLNLSRCNIGILRDGKGKFYEYKDLEAQLWGNPAGE